MGLSQHIECVVIGAGASGMMCAGTAAENGNRVVVVEKNKMAGRKLLITGKGRCNVTNNCDAETFFANIVSNPRFMMSSFSAFSNEDTIRFFETLGVPLKTERGNRVFPSSDKASDICNALKKYCDDCGVKFERGDVVSLIVENGRILGVRLSDGREIFAENTVVATGGKSYPLTGSDGKGYELARSCGHDIVEPRAALVPLVFEEKSLCARLEGLSLRNVGIKLVRNGKTVYDGFGEMVFTHDGMSGPEILSARSVAEKGDRVSIDLKPALDEKTLDARLISDFSKNLNRNFSNSLSELLPSKLIPVIIDLSGIAPDKKVNSITSKERARLLELLKSLCFTVHSRGDINEAIVTSGGVSVKNVCPKNMRSKIIKNLYFCGEVLDVDAYTGGFNLQIAFSTGYCAGKDIGTWE